ncbi:hypothetical protein M5K25_020533 [Dendrobium thyrsiflorum]|uniref:Uncharacterized protein n=1 Tax=Dendrobium thyrsiflorum TaxID=117978 RepID=A0ABD0UA39_DENTH
MRRLENEIHLRRTSFTTLSKLTTELPLGPVALAALSFHFTAFSLIFFPFTPPIISLINSSTSFLLTSLLISIPTPQSVHEYLQFVCCSAKKGQQIIGTPPHKLSSVEFQPEWVKKTPTAGCVSSSSCAHHLTISPLSLTTSMNSGGSTADSPFTRSGRITQRKWLAVTAARSLSFGTARRARAESGPMV